jgi:hypothetical protein
MSSQSELASPNDSFARRHLGDSAADVAAMLAELGYSSVDALIDTAVPAHIRSEPLRLPAAAGESAALAELRAIASDNKVFRNFIGMGYSDTLVPAVIQRTILENPAWYTAYTPYQAEISQGRLEALLNFQTVVCDLTGLEIANASMLDEGTAAAEAMMMCHRLKEGDASAHRAFFVSESCHPQTIDIVRTRAKPLGIEVVVGDHRSFKPAAGCFGVLVQYPDTWGSVHDYAAFFARPTRGRFCIVAADLLALALLRPPGEFGADVAVGSAQRFGVPPGFGGPHAGFLATRDAFKRQMPGPPGRRLQGRAGRPGHAPRPRHARAAHPQGQGHVQHLHGPGAPRRHGVHVRRLPRPGGPQEDRPPHEVPHGAARGRPQGRGGEDRGRALLRHADGGQRRPGEGPRGRGGQGLQPAPDRRGPGRDLARRDDDEARR